MQKETENLEFFQGVNFENIDSLKNNGTKYLLFFDDSWEEICISKAFVDNDTAGRHRGLSTIYIKHNLFHQSKLGRDFELQNTHIVLFKSPRDVMQVKTLIAHLGLGSEVADWYGDATFVHCGHLLIDLSPRTDDRLRYCINTGSIPSKYCIPDRLKQSKILDNERTNFLYFTSVPIVFPELQKHFHSVLPKEFIQFLCECIINQRKPGRARFDYCLLNIQLGSKLETLWRPKKAYSSLKYLHLPSLTFCLDMEKFVLVPASVYNRSLITQSVTKQELRKY